MVGGSPMDIMGEDGRILTPFDLIDRILDPPD